MEIWKNNVRYHGRNLTIVWDKDGGKYKRGQVLSLFVNGQKIANTRILSRISGNL
ncbi:MAG: glycosyl hydrolase family 65 protein [Desulfobacterales bacterium]